MVFVGMDHGTTGVSFTILGDEVEHFKIGREELSAGRVSALEELEGRVSPEEIELMAITYAMGDGINRIKPIDRVKNRGIISIGGAGKVTGGGTAVYSEIESSGIPTVLIPGLHRNTPCLDERFRAAYSHHASPEKVSICYNAYLETGWENMIVSDISSNTVTMLIQDGKIRGAMDACIGAMGVIHGPLDLEMLRKIDDSEKTANECFSHAGAVKIAGIDTRVSRARDELLDMYLEGRREAALALETMIMTIAMEIWGLAGISERLDGIVLTGSMGAMREPYDFHGKLAAMVNELAPVKRLDATSGSMGSAQIARDIHGGKRDILGIEVDI
ncbi:methanogenesis marker 12 protein [Methanothermobacter sp. KEPCO-1]|uniref:methanogenesis marker 12 protein n=1 Tax=Methanothermobacter TaxID=145260 RepID=UPI0011CA533F|nr:methanogenesis marker 12 protein [Methanothermobacter sp. KEPCO-1]QEF94460.1 methanogenesis marker 12 protein [Methanothermobacter sp. KEPCO-1]